MSCLCFAQKRNRQKKWDTSAGTGKLCILGHLGLVFIWSCFVSCLLFLLFYVSLRNLCSGTCRKIQEMRETACSPCSPHGMSSLLPKDLLLLTTFGFSLTSENSWQFSVVQSCISFKA